MRANEAQVRLRERVQDEEAQGISDRGEQAVHKRDQPVQLRQNTQLEVLCVQRHRLPGRSGPRLPVPQGPPLRGHLRPVDHAHGQVQDSRVAQDLDERLLALRHLGIHAVRRGAASAQRHRHLEQEGVRFQAQL